MGITKEKQSNLYNEFVQSGGGDNFHGTGLGLPIVKKILDLHNSEIILESELGKGTKINFELVYDPAVVTKTAIDLSQIDKTSVFKGKHILAVDDNHINQIVTSKILKLYGATVSVAGGGAEAVEMANENTFDLILMDINMPDVDGFQATVAIRAFNSSIPIVALTAVEPEKVTGAHSFSLMNDLIIKPYANEVFVNTILKHI
jgi:CheY-like chemotaxis protein